MASSDNKICTLCYDDDGTSTEAVTWCTECEVLPDGKYIILDSHSTISNLLLFSNDGMLIRKVVSFKGCSNDVCFIRTNTVAVTLAIENKKVLVDVVMNKTIKTIRLSHYCGAIASDDQMLVISSTEKCTIVNLNDNSNTILKGVWADGIALSKGNIYGTIFMENKVFCYKITGEPLWTFQHHDMVKPGGIILDKNGFVYIASYGNDRILVIPPDGKTCKTILSDVDGIIHPYHAYAIDINRETGMMIVASRIRDDSYSKTNSYRTAFVYKI